jgi:hypothetical protein
MFASNKSSASTKSSYVPPSLRGKKPTAAASQTHGAPSSFSLLASTKKTALKKEFAIEPTAFPSLGETIKKSTIRGTPISFSTAASKKVELPKEVKVEVLPGWVHISRQEKGGIQYKYGNPVMKEDQEEMENLRISRIILKNRIAREQYDRDRDIECLGDLSEFYGQLALNDVYENETEPIYSDDENEYSN